MGTKQHEQWKPTPDEVRAILAELRPLLHGPDPKPCVEGWDTPADDAN